MSQSIQVSVVEAMLNQLSGVCLATIVWMVAAPWWGFETGWVQSFELSLFFMVISTVRSLIWRRLFENHLTTWLQKRIG